MATEETEDIIERCKDFLHRSAERYSTYIQNQERCLEALGGKFWEQGDLKKDWKIGKKPVIHNDIFNRVINGISSPYSSSPYHTSLVNQELEGLQQSIDRFEHDFEVKNNCQKGFKRGTGVGSGFVVIGLDEKLFPTMEFASQQSSVAFDPDVKTPDGRDAEEGATISWYSIKKAQREFGADVIPTRYPSQCAGLDLSDCKMWGNKKDYIQVVNYYVKGDNEVILYKICGTKVVAEPNHLPIDRIPIIRFAGYEAYDMEDGIDYTGVVQRLWDSQLAYDLTWTKQMTRMQQTLKARAVVGISAAKGVKEYLQKMEGDDSLALLYNDQPVNGVVPKEPTITNEIFNTADLTQVLTNVRSCIPDVTGIPLEGSQSVERTATEVLTQQVNNESNVAELYCNAEAANRTIGRIIVMLLNNGVYEDFSLENGPAIITSNMKRRQEIQTVAQFYPEDKKMLLAIDMAKTIESEAGNRIAEVTKANLPDGMKLPGDTSEGAALYALGQTQKQFEAAINAANEYKAQVQELQQQVRELQIANSDMKAERAMEWAKFQTDTALRVQQTDFENDMERKKFLLDQDKVILDAKTKERENQRKAAEALTKAGV